ncbi:Dockerin type I repeat protein [Roseimaritima multifibrata]|uniref:Dockerin type I repeat protein n=1 Tax=Roseimaritima multifibrata TaxID=1930274 RepID=A0A517MA48_9BACT|nr:dockerin type I domain-containing protein [Roseimaritima multifibrata]QDS91756.1 Dockerin type I repeat protein [Roseimaritima multifibrata]
MLIRSERLSRTSVGMRRTERHIRRQRRLIVESLEDRRLLAVFTEGIDFWGPQGPQPTINAQVENIPSTGAGANPVVGAVHTVLPDPTDADVLYLGATNGGIWKTTDATAASPTWTPLTDQFASLSTGAMEFDTTDGTNQTILVGIGHTSSWSRIGGALTGLLRTTDGGATWDPLGQDDLIGRNVVGVAIRGNTMVVAANNFGGGVGGGIYRSDDGGVSFDLVSGTAGLPTGAAFDLVSDPTDSNRLYASVSGIGLFRTDDLGVTWNNITSGDASQNAAFTALGNNNGEMSVASNGRVYVGVIANGQPNYLGYSDDPTSPAPTWMEMDLPVTQESDGDFEGLSPRSKPGGQGAIHFSILADPNNPSIVYVGGDRQDSPFVNAIGSNNFTGRLFRGDTTIASINPGSTTNILSPQWEHLTNVQDMGFVDGGTASNSSPHADSREMVFDANGDLIETDDGGIYRRTSPTDNTGDWFSLVGNLQITEFHDIAYDSNSDIIIGGAQDTGTPEQTATGSLTYDSVTQADGGDVAVDTLVGGGNSLRYASTQNFTTSFRYRVFDAGNSQVGATVFPSLAVGGGGAAITSQFATPVITNAVAPNRLILGGGNSTYESMDRGENLTEIAPGLVINAPGNGDRDGIPVVYGGRLNNVDNPEILYVGSGNQVFLRTTAAGPLNATAALPAGATNVQGIAVDPENWMTVYVVDSDQVFRSFDAGDAWEEVSGNLNDFLLRTVRVVNGPGSDAVLVGGANGVYRMLTTSDQVWTEYGAGLPNAPVSELVYDTTDDLFLAGTLGRGAWTVDSPINLFTPSVLTVCGDDDHLNQDDQIRLMLNAGNPTLLDVFVNNPGTVPDFQMPIGLFQQINVFGVGGNDELIIDSSNGLLSLPMGIRYSGDGVCTSREGDAADPIVGLDRGFDRLTITTVDSGTEYVSEEVAVGQLPGSGRHSINDASGSQVVWFEELEPVTTIVNAATFAITSIPGLASLLQDDNHVTYEAPQILPAPAGRVTVDNFEPIEFSNKANVTINLGSGDDFFVGNHNGLPTGLETLTVNGDAGDDSVQFENIPDASSTSFVSVTINGGVGDDLLDAREVQVETAFALRGDQGRDTLVGGRGDDSLQGGDGDDLMVGGDPRAFAAGFLIGDNTYDGGAGFDQMGIYGTDQLSPFFDDAIAVTQSSTSSLVRNFNGNSAIETFSGLEEVRIDLFAGDDLVTINIDDSLFDIGNDPRPDVLRYHVVGGDSNTGDLLRVVDDGIGDTILQRIAHDRQSGTFTIAPNHSSVTPFAMPSQIVYEGIAFAEVANADPVSGGTGTDGAGRWVVFKPDPFESNNTLPNATFLGAGATINVDPTIDGSLALDRDFYQITAASTGVLDYRVYFETLPTLANGRGGLPGNGELRARVYDSDGTLVGVSTNLLDAAGNMIGLRFTHGAVEDQTYYLRVEGQTNAALNVYSVAVENEVAPVPSVVDLQAASDSGRHDSDNITNVVTSTFDILLDDDRLDTFLNLDLLPDTSDDNTANAAFDYGVEVFNNEVSLGFAFYTGVGNTWRFTAAPGDLLEGHNNFVEAAVWVRDSATPEQIGRGELGGTLQVTLDTVAPPVSIVGINPGQTDTGVIPQALTFTDRITSDAETGFWGIAEADAIVRLYVDGLQTINNDNNLVDNPGEFRLTVASPLDGDEVFEVGQWQASFIRNLNDPAFFDYDGLREVLVTAEDLAGNVNTVNDANGDDGQVLDVFIDTQGPQVTDIEITGHSAYDLFDIKPAQGPTPLVNALTVSVQDLPDRIIQFLYDALESETANSPGHYQVIGDHNGSIAIDSVAFTPDVPVPGSPATGKIQINFANPLPDDRFTLTISDAVVDPAGNALDGDSNASQPNEAPVFPSGDGQPGGDFVARFTVDSRAEIGTFAFGGVYIDTNGNNVFDPEDINSDDTNEDIVYKLGFQTDNVFAGNFVAGAGDVADGFAKLAAYGQVAGQFRWLIDTNNNSVTDLVVADPAQVNGRPVAGNFDGNAVNGDEVGLKDGTIWYLDTSHDFQVDTTLNGDMVGLPIVGDFDGDGIDDLGAWADDVFSLDLSADGIDGFTDQQFTFGFPGVREIPVAADFNGDGLDDIGLWNPDGGGVAPGEQADWMILLSQPASNVQLDTGVFNGVDSISSANPQGTFLADDFVPVDPSQEYHLSGQARSGDGVGGQFEANNRQYFGFASYDSDQLQIVPFHVNRFANAADTQLAAPLNPGDTQIVLQDASGWANAGAAHHRSLAWYGYTNSDGYTYPDYTYTRNVASNLTTGLWSAGGIAGNVITLNQPWAGPAIPAGMAVRNTMSGGTYSYAALSYQSVPEQWTEYGATLSGSGMGLTQFRPGTAFIKPVMLTNFVAGSTNLINWRNVEVSVSTAAVPVTDRIVPNPQGAGNVIDFTPEPFGPDLYASYGDAFALPVVGNFDPPVVPASGSIDPVVVVGLNATNAVDAYDVDGSGTVEPRDALAVINYLNRHGSGAYGEGVQVEASGIQQSFGAMPDVNGDGRVEPQDALRVINRLNRLSRDAALQGEIAAGLSATVTAEDKDASLQAGDELAVLDASTRKLTQSDTAEVFSQWPVDLTIDSKLDDDEEVDLEQLVDLIALGL